MIQKNTKETKRLIQLEIKNTYLRTAPSLKEPQIRESTGKNKVNKITKKVDTKENKNY